MGSRQAQVGLDGESRFRWSLSWLDKVRFGLSVLLRGCCSNATMEMAPMLRLLRWSLGSCYWSLGGGCWVVTRLLRSVPKS